MDNVSAPRFPIGAVSKLTGISLDTLRAWERRYQAVTPARDERGRVYTDRHIDRLEQLAELVDRGHSIGSIAALSDTALRRLRSSDRAAVDIAPSVVRVDLDPLRHAIDQYDLVTLESFIARHALFLPPPDLIFGIILPALRDVGARWQAGDICPAQEHLFSGAVRSALGGVLCGLPQRDTARRTVFATPSGDRHELGLLCGAVLAAWTGRSVLYLGPDVPAADIAHAIGTTRATTLVLAATTDDAVDTGDGKRLRRLPSAVTICAGGTQGHALRSAIGPRVTEFPTLESLHTWLDRHAH